MVPRKRIVVITSDAKRHRYFANRLDEEFELMRVYAEAKVFDPVSKTATELGRKHFEELHQAQERYFGAEKAFNAPETRVDAGAINDPAIIEQIRCFHPDLIALFGSSKLGAGYFETFGAAIVNMHLGLSPYYRGSGTNFWPLVNSEPEYVGATIHVATEKLDAGAILAHARPEIAAGDGPHDIGCKAIIAGTSMFVKAAHHYEPGKTAGVTQWPVERQRLCLRKDVSDEAIARLYRNFAAGMIAEYLADKSRRDAALRLVTLETQR